MLLPYLDKDGHEMRPETKPVFLRDETKAQSYARVARYVECKRRDVQGLIWIGHCEKCPNFQGHEKYNGVNCAIKITEKDGKRKDKTTKDCRAEN